MTLNVVVENGGEEAYNAKLVIDWPHKVTYNRALVSKTSSGGASSASSSSSSSSACTLACETCHRLTCNLGNPLRAGERRVVRVDLETSEVRSSQILVKTHVFSDNKETEETLGDNEHEAELKVSDGGLSSVHCTAIFCAGKKL